MRTRLPEFPPDVSQAAARRVMARCDELARVTATPGAIERVYLSPEHARVNRLAAEWMREVGMTTWQDAAGNQLGGSTLDGAAGTRSGSGPTGAARDRPRVERPPCMLGSHLDTVPDAGRYDGIVGVLMALEVVRLLRARRGRRRRHPALPFALEVVAFSDEEGTRFGKALLGSSAVAGIWDDAWWSLTDADGTTLRAGLPRVRPRPRPHRRGRTTTRTSSSATSRPTSSRVRNWTGGASRSRSSRRSRAPGASS